MPVVPFIPLIAAGVGVGASIYGANKAAGAAKNAAAQNNALQTDIYNKNQTNLNPYIQQGNTASSAIANLLGLSGSNGAAGQSALSQFQNMTGFQTQLANGVNAINSQAATRGLLNSGANLKNISNYGQQQALGSFQTLYGDLAGQQQVGLSGASALAGVGQGYANAVSQNNNNAADASGNAALYGSSAISSLLAGLGKQTGSYSGSYGASGGGNFASSLGDLGDAAGLI